MEKQGGIVAWFANNGVAANLLMGGIVFLGLWSLSARIILEVFPEFERDIVTIAVVYRGATPSEVEESVIIRIEEAIADLEGIKKMESSAHEGAGRVSIEVEKGRAQALLNDIKNRVDAINTFPEEVERPIFAVQSVRRNVISVVVSGDLPENELRRLGERVRDDLVALPEVSLVEMTGIRAYEISIEVDDFMLAQHDLTFDEVVSAIRRTSVDLPAGSIKTKQGEILLRTQGQAYHRGDFARIPILSRPGGSQLTLGDIAQIRDGFEEEPLYSQFNGRPAVMIEVYRTGHQSALEVGRAVRDYVKASHDTMPEGIALGYWRDRSRIVKLRLETLLNNALQGGVLVFICLALFLRISVAVWVCVGIPVSFLGALALLPEMGITLNLLSLFAFILVLGIVVDDAIITSENIYSHLKHASSSLEAVIQGTNEVAVPVTFGLLTTLAAFMPLMFIEGDRGPIFAQIPMIVIPVLAFSWIESKLILPSHMRHVAMRRDEDAPKKGFYRWQHAIADGMEQMILTVYRPFLERVLEYRYLTFALFIGLSFVVFSFILSGRYGFTFFPKIQSETARATLSMQTGTSEAITTQHVLRMTQIAEKLRDKYRDPVTGESVVSNILTSVGWSAGGRSSGSPGGGAALGQVSMELVPPEERTLEISTSQLVKEWRQAIGPIAGAQELNFRAEIGRGGDPIDVQLTGQDFSLLSRLADQVRKKLGEYPGVFDIQDTFENGKPQVRLSVRPEAVGLGLTNADLGRQVRQAFFGAEVQRIQRGRDDVRVMVRYPKIDRESLASLDTMHIRTADGLEVPIGNVATLNEGRGFADIRRKDRQRTINVTADVNKEAGDINPITDDLKIFLDTLLSPYPSIHYSFEGELREQRDSFGSLFYGVIFVLFSIYALLAIPLRSYLQPIIVMLVIPFSVVGAVLGHMLLGMNLSFMSMLGILALGGVVVNDSLVLVDWINQRRLQGMPLQEAVSMAGVARFRAIFLTSITTFCGLAPLIWAKSTQAQFLIPMAVSLGFGILYATLLSLIMVPASCVILEDILKIFGKK